MPMGTGVSYRRDDFDAPRDCETYRAETAGWWGNRQGYEDFSAWLGSWLLDLV
jgi:hypothetical protein